jgi:hypothetical protein
VARMEAGRDMYSVLVGGHLEDGGPEGGMGLEWMIGR